MPAPDLIRRADVLIRFGRRKQAVRELRDALASDPNQMDVREKLAEFEVTPKGATLGATVHLCMSWVFLFGPLLLLVPVSPWLRRILDGSLAEGLGPAWALCIGLLLAAVWGAVAGVISLHLWFLYLKHVARSYRPEVESRLHHFVAVERFEPFYSRARFHYFNDAK